MFNYQPVSVVQESLTQPSLKLNLDICFSQIASFSHTFMQTVLTVFPIYSSSPLWSYCVVYPPSASMQICRCAPRMALNLFPNVPLCLVSPIFKSKKLFTLVIQERTETWGLLLMIRNVDLMRPGRGYYLLKRTILVNCRLYTSLILFNNKGNDVNLINENSQSHWHMLTSCPADNMERFSIVFCWWAVPYQLNTSWLQPEEPPQMTHIVCSRPIVVWV